MPSPNQILYSTAAIFKASGADASTDITTSSDTILLNDPAYTIYEYESSLAVLEQTGTAAADSATININKKLVELYNLFRGDNPSQNLRQIGSYYDDNNLGI